MRQCNIGTTNEVPLDNEWAKQALASDRVIIVMTYADFGLGEECLVRIECNDPHYIQTMYQVGVGESMRPYRHIYYGTDGSYATTCFAKELIRLAGQDPTAEQVRK